MSDPAPSSALRALRDWSLAWALRFAWGIGQRLPEAWILGGVAGLASLLSRLPLERRRRVEGRVQQTLGHASGSPDSRRIVRGAYRTLLLNLVETALVERRLRRGEPISKLVVVEGREHLAAALAGPPVPGPSGRRARRAGVLVCTGHIGAWELQGPVLARFFERLWVVARPPRNPWLLRWARERRDAWSLGMLDKDGGSLPLVRALLAGEPVGALLDQNAGRRGIPLDFLGLTASHHRIAGVVARRCGALVVPAYLLREPGRLRFRLVIEPAIRCNSELPTPEAQEADVVARLSRSLEARVRAAPEEWLWLHDRWRHAQLKLRRRARMQAALRDAAEALAAPVEEGTTER